MLKSRGRGELEGRHYKDGTGMLIFKKNCLHTFIIIIAFYNLHIITLDICRMGDLKRVGI